MTNETTKLVVTQADRDAAVDLLGAPAFAYGYLDNSPTVQAFARHRLASQAVVSQDLVPVASIGITIDPPSPVSLEQIARVLLATGECETCGTPCGTYIECNCERPIWAPASNITKARAIIPIIEAAQIAARNDALEDAAGIAMNEPYWETDVAEAISALRTPLHKESE